MSENGRRVAMVNRQSRRWGTGGMGIERGLFVALLCAVCCVHCVLNEAHAGSPFYLTVERGFSTDEHPQVRLDFTKQSEPMVLRVLRPKNLEAFLAGQLNISRSYEEPVSEINPGNYIFRGMNELEAPLAPLRSLLSADLRRQFRAPDFGQALREPVRVPLVSVPKEVSIGGPAGFEVAREVFLDLQSGGEIPESSNWFWEPAESEDSSYKVRTIDLEPLPDGVYLLQAVQGKIEAQALLQVSSLAVQVKQSSTQLLVRTVNRSLQPVEGCTVSYRDGRGKWRSSPQKTSRVGELLFNNPEGILDGKLVVRVEAADGRSAMTQTDFLPAVSVENSVYMVTDRPIFKPGETFFFKGIVRLLENGALRVPQITKPEAAISLFRSDGVAVDRSAKVSLSEFGSFSGSLSLGETQPPGLYRIVADVDGKPYAGEFRVKDYVKPKFYLDITDRDPTIRPGEKFSLQVRAKTYSGALPKEVHYEVFVYRRRFEVPQFVLESGSGLQAGEDYFGNIRTATSLAQPQRIYSSIEARSPGDEADISSSWATAPALDERGEARIEFEIPKSTPGDEKIEWSYSIMVRAQDSAGSFAVASDTIHATLSNVVVAGKFREPVTEAGQDSVPFVIRATSPDGAPLRGVTGHVQLRLSTEKGDQSLSPVDFVTGDAGFVTIRLPLQRAAGVLSAAVSATGYDGKPLSPPSVGEEAKLVVGGADGAAVIPNRDLQLFATQTVLSPGEKSKLLALLPEEWGENNRGPLWQTVAGTKVYATHTETISGRSRWIDVEAKPEFGTGFYQTVTVPTGKGTFSEQTVGFRVVPIDKRLAIKVTPSADVAEPMKDFPLSIDVSDSLGKPAANVELAVDVVDRAVYAVQPEFRPDVMEFFYPLPRLNVANFYSDELQGFGYADEIRRPNFQLSALKSRNKPVKRSLRDTAGWFPHVVTDSEGRATVNVPMPANITEWLVTVIGADKLGRLGEGHGKFRSAADLSADAIVPQFLREGDLVQGNIRIENHLDRPVTVQTRPAGEGGLQTAAAADEQKSAQIPAKSSVDVPVELTANVRADGGAEGGSAVPVLRVGLDAGKDVRSGGAEEFDMSVSPRSIELDFDSGVLRGDSPVPLQVPNDAVVRRIRVQVSPGLLGSALAAARNLVTYPYGCAEQLVHTTMPNLVVLDLLEKAKIPREKYGAFQLQGLVSQAKERAELGFQKLAAHQKPDGGFVLWGSESESNLALTALVTRALTLGVRLEVPGAMRMREKAIGFLASQSGSWSYREGNAMDGYTLALLADAQLLSSLKDQYMSYVDSVVNNPNADPVSLVSAVRILQRLKGQWWVSGEMHLDENVETLTTRLAALFASPDRGPRLRSVSADFSELGFSPGEVSFIAAALGILKTAGKLTPPMQSQGVELLRARMQGGIWYSTFETGEVILNLQELLQDEIRAFAEGVTAGRQVMLHRTDGTVPLQLTPFPGGFYGDWESRDAGSRMSGLRLSGLNNDERGEVMVTADVPYASVKSQANGIKVTRRLLRIASKGHYELYKGEPLHRGDTVVSEVLVERASAERWVSPPSSFVVLEDSIPSIAQAIDEDAPYLADAKLIPDPDAFGSVIRDTKRYPDKTVRVLELAPGASHTSYQVWRVAFSGRASLAPARAFDMYQTVTAGNSSAGEVVASPQ